MCGITITHSQEEAKLSLRALKHRGDRNTYTKLGNLWYAHRRLPINGISKKYDQPYWFRNAPNWMVGEYYDYSREKYPNDLMALAHKINSGPLIPLGMFLFIQAHKNGFIAHQDFWNKKPFYYRSDLKAFASEIKALTALAPVTLNKKAFIDYEKKGYSCDYTPYNEIKRIKNRILYYHDQHQFPGSSVDFFLPPRNSFNSLNKILWHAIKIRSKADVPVAMLCSGGLDSSLIYFILRKQGQNPHVFHIENNESQYLKYLNIPKDKLHIIKIDQGFDLKEILYYNETPQDLGSMVPQYLLGKAIKESGLGIRVIITGDGADELFGGYKRCNPLADNRYSDLYPELKNYHIPRLDKLMMAHTLEVRSPYLDEKIFSWSSQKSWSEIVNKKPIKQLAKELGLAPEIINRRKMPLKFHQVKDNKLEWRKYIISEFKKSFYKGLEL